MCSPLVNSIESNSLRDLSANRQVYPVEKGKYPIQPQRLKPLKIFGRQNLFTTLKRGENMKEIFQGI